MALNVGELVANLRLDDDQYTRGLQQAEARLRQLDATAQQMGNSIRDATSTAGRQLQGLGDDAQQAGREVEQIGDRAQDANRRTRDIEIPSTLAQDAQRAAREVEGIGRAAEQSSQQLRDAQGRFTTAGSEGGRAAGSGFLSGFGDKLGNLASKGGPIAGSLLGIAGLGVGAGIALAAAIKDGMDQELSRDIFQAQTRTTTAQAEKFAQAAGEAYADVFGESVQGNLNTLKLAIQNNIIDPAATQRDAEAVIASLDTIAVALDSDVSQSVLAVSALMNTGLAGSAQEASDMLAQAVGGSANRMEDLLDIVNEYSSGWKNAGISGEQALALLEQATDKGAFTADNAGDALREWGRRMSEESESVIAALDDMGLAGQDMFDKMSAGGPEGAEAFDAMFDALRAIEDPLARNAAVAALLGDSAGDFYDVFQQWDPSEALRDFGEFEGAAGRLADIMGGNAATSVEGAMRSISVVTDGLKNALAQAFGPQIQEWANAVSNNREGVISFFQGIMNAAFDGGEAILRFASGGIRGFADLAKSGSEMAATILGGIADLLDGVDMASGVLGAVIPGFGALMELGGPDFGDMANSLRGFATDLEEGGATVGEWANTAADAIDNTLIPGLDRAQERANETVEKMKLSAAYNDESAKVTAAISSIGEAADGSVIPIQNWTGAIDRSNAAQVQMEDGLRGLVGQFQEQVRTGLEAGTTVEALTAQYQSNYDALLGQLMATGMNNEAAVAYLNTLGLTPDLVATQIEQPGMPDATYAMDVLKDKVLGVPDSKTIETSALSEDAMDTLRQLGLTVETLPNGNVRVSASTDEAERTMLEWLSRSRSVEVKVALRRAYWLDQGVSPDLADQIQGPIPMTPRAEGGLPDQAMIARGDRTLYQWNEPGTGGEGFIPLAPAKRPRSLAIWAEIGRRFGVLQKMAEGGISESDMARMGGGTVNASLWQALKTNVPDAQLTSAKTDHDDDGGYHPRGMAIDVNPSQANADYLWSIRSQLGQIITTIPERIWYNVNGEGQTGQAAINTYGPGVVAQHDNHIHAMANAIISGAGAGGGTAAQPLPGVGQLTSSSTKEEIARAIIGEGRMRGYTDEEIKAILATGLQESDLNPGAVGGGGAWHGVFQQDESYPGRDDPNSNIATFYDRLDEKRRSAPGGDIWKDIFWLQQRPGESSADAALSNGRQAYMSEIQSKSAEADQLLAGAGAGTTSSSLGSGDYAAMTSATGSGGVQEVFVVNWPTALGGGEREPIAQFSAKLFGSGGIENHSPQIANAMRIWAEPETGGEAYIPLSPSKRAASLAIWAETGRRLGVMGFAGGGFGGYTGPDTRDYMAPRNGYDALALGAGLLFTAASGLSGVASMASSGTVNLGDLAPVFDTSANQLPGSSEAFKALVEPLEKILETLKKGGMIDAQVTVDTNTGAVNASLQKVGIA